MGILKAAMTFLKTYWRASVILAVVLVLALGGVWRCRPKPVKTVEEENAPAKAAIDEKFVAEQGKRNRELQDRLGKLERADALRREEARAASSRMVEAALKGGPHAMATYLGRVLAPGESDRLSTEYWSR